MPVGGDRRGQAALAWPLGTALTHSVCYLQQSVPPVRLTSGQVVDEAPAENGDPPSSVREHGVAWAPGGWVLSVIFNLHLID